MSASLPCRIGNSSAAAVSSEQPQAGAAALGDAGERRAQHARRRRKPVAFMRGALSGLSSARARPNRPVGAKTRTSTRIEKMITSVQRGGDELAAQRLDQADQDAADHRAGDAADAAEHRGGERPQPGGDSR